MTTTKETLIRRYHTIAGRLEMQEEERKAFLGAWNVTSSKEMTAKQLEEACRALADLTFSKQEDTWRKRVMASIFNWFKLTGKQVDAEYVKGVACRATGYGKFNAIPVDKLRSVYHTFVHKQTIFARTGEIINDELTHLATNN